MKIIGDHKSLVFDCFLYVEYIFSCCSVGANLLHMLL